MHSAFGYTQCDSMSSVCGVTTKAGVAVWHVHIMVSHLCPAFDGMHHALPKACCSLALCLFKHTFSCTWVHASLHLVHRINSMTSSIKVLDSHFWTVHHFERPVIHLSVARVLIFIV